MLHHPIDQQLQSLRLSGMVKALSEQREQPAIAELGFEERLGLLLDREITLRDTRRLQTRLRQAKLKHPACMEDIDYQSRRLDKTLMAKLTQCQWVSSHHNIFVIGPTGTGKTYLACALSHKACLEGYSSRYHRLSRLMPELKLARGDGRYSAMINDLAKIDVLLLDDFGLVPLTDEYRRDLLEILDDRHNKRSTIVTSQLPVKLWHEAIGDKTLADAILDRLVHNAYRIELKGESMRKLGKAQIEESHAQK